MRDKLEAFRYGPNPLKTWCRRGESNPHESHPSPDFESGASANSATPAYVFVFNSLALEIVSRHRPISLHCAYLSLVRLPIPLDCA